MERILWDAVAAASNGICVLIYILILIKYMIILINFIKRVIRSIIIINIGIPGWSAMDRLGLLVYALAQSNTDIVNCLYDLWLKGLS